MWSSVTPCDGDTSAPSARSKHSATVLAGHIYLLGGRNRNVPLKDFWKYHLASGNWYELHPSGDKLPCLQEHTAVAYRDAIYVFGGEVSFSADTETPLWKYDTRNNSWKKVRSRKGVVVPRGRRGHTALVHKGTMLVYGGYQDLRGSCSELWAFHFETESWHLISGTTPNHRQPPGDLMPPPRHRHSAVLHDDCMWVYGGMTDLQERADLWRWDTRTRTWSAHKPKHMPGALHGHAACRLPSSMLVFGGERDGQPTNDVWKFHFDTESWEKLLINGLKPQPRAECVAFAVSELLLKDTTGTSHESKMAETRIKISTANEKSKSAYITQRRVAPLEKTYVFKASQENYNDGSDIAQQFAEPTGQSANPNGGFLKEISKLSQLNLSRLGHNKCSYSVLTTGNNESTESLLRQHAGAQETDSEHTTPTRMVKSKSAYAIKKKFNEPKLIEETDIDCVTQRNTRLNVDVANRMTREPISVPNFATITLPTPVLTPVEVARLVFLDSEDEIDEDDKDPLEVRPASPKNYVLYENFKSVKRGESYNSHLGYADNPLYQHMVMSTSVKFDKCPAVEEISDENGFTSDYASIETMNRLSSASNYNVSRQTPEETNASLFKAKGKVHEGPFGFCNPNYMGPDVQTILTDGKKAWGYETDKKQVNKMLNTPDSVLEDSLGRSTSGHMLQEESVEMQTVATYETPTPREQQQNKCNLRFSSRKVSPKSLELEETSVCKARNKCRASSASRVERQNKKTPPVELDPFNPTPDVFVPLYIFVVGGKEQGQVTVFKRPISIWKLKLF